MDGRAEVRGTIFFLQPTFSKSNNIPPHQTRSTAMSELARFLACRLRSGRMAESSTAPVKSINFSDRRERRVISTVVYHHRLASSIGLSFIPTAVFLKLAWFDRAAEVVFVRWKMILLRNTDKCSCVGYLYNLLTNNTKIVHVPHWILRHCTLCFTVRWLTGPTRSSC